MKVMTDCAANVLFLRTKKNSSHITKGIHTTMKVELLSYTPDSEKLVAAAARNCYSSVGIDDIMEDMTQERVDKFLDRLDSNGHESPIEHASFTFAVEGVSRSLLAQLTRHRIASFSVQSQRYVENKRISCVTPPAISEDQYTNDIFDVAISNAYDSYQKLVDELTNRYVQRQSADLKEDDEDLDIKMKRCITTAKKKAIEDARYVLPNACTTQIVFTMNARSLRNFFKLRCCNRAQGEIREMADKMLFLCREVAPSLFKHAGPSCVREGCSEGTMCCGNTRKDLIP